MFFPLQYPHVMATIYTNRYFSDKPWPEPDNVCKIIDDGIFGILYRELFYRHIFIKLRKPVQQDRHGAYNNYIALFEYILCKYHFEWLCLSVAICIFCLTGDFDCLLFGKSC